MTTINTDQPVTKRLEIVYKALVLLAKARYKVLWGGRGSGKSWSIARILILIACMFPVRVLCAREIQNSINDSVHKLLSDQIESMGVSHLFTITNNTITGTNGAEFIFKGLKHNIGSIKSFEGIDIVWIEEAENISKNSWEKLIPTIRKQSTCLAKLYNVDVAMSEIWVSFNPNEEKDPTYQMFVVNPEEDAVVVKINFDDNPWFKGSPLEKHMLHMYRTDPDTAAHVYGGELRKNSQAQIFGPIKIKNEDGTVKLVPKYRVQEFTVGAGWNGPYFGADWGFANDPNTLVKCWVYDNKLYVEYEAYAIGVENNKIEELWDSVPGSRLWATQRINGVLEKSLAPVQHTIRADSARPETIVHVAGYGFNVIPAVKWPGSVEDGIRALRTFDEIIVHPRCKHAEEEFRLYHYKVDQITGDVLPIVVDAHNHIIDPIRYALEPWIRLYTEQVVSTPAPVNPIASDLDDLDGAGIVGEWRPSSW